MRPVSGFERPMVQWAFAALSVVLIAIVAAQAIALRRGRARMEALHAAELNARLEHETIAKRMAREQTAREALALEVSRLRGTPAAGSPLPVLTLQPLLTPSTEPPPPTVAPPDPAQLIALRLVLPPAAPLRRPHSLTIRNWSGGETVWMRGGLVPAAVEGRQMIVAHVAGDVFAAGSYELSATTTGENGQPLHTASYEVTVR